MARAGEAEEASSATQHSRWKQEASAAQDAVLVEALSGMKRSSLKSEVLVGRDAAVAEASSGTPTAIWRFVVSAVLVAVEAGAFELRSVRTEMGLHDAATERLRSGRREKAEICINANPVVSDPRTRSAGHVEVERAFETLHHRRRTWTQMLI
jgi:hypothetical protein